MDKQTELEIRAQSMIRTLKAQIADAMDGCIQLQAEIAVCNARIVELEDQLEAANGATGKS